MDCCTKETYLSKETVKELKRVLYLVFFINAGMFLTEVVSGIIANSSALLADSLDMFGDTFVYGLSLFVLTKHHKIQAKVSMIKGMIMLLFGLYIFWEAFHKLTHQIIPTAQTISFIGLLALIANTTCFFLLKKHQNKNLNLKSAWICSRNDMYGNMGVIGAGLLVGYFNSVWPDVIIGLGIALLVLHSSVKIIRESWSHMYQ